MHAADGCVSVTCRVVGRFAAKCFCSGKGSQKKKKAAVEAVCMHVYHDDLRVLVSGAR
jgi:hypothetical protein